MILGMFRSAGEDTLSIRKKFSGERKGRWIEIDVHVFPCGRTDASVSRVGGRRQANNREDNAEREEKRGGDEHASPRAPSDI